MIFAPAEYCCFRTRVRRNSSFIEILVPAANIKNGYTGKEWAIQSWFCYCICVFLLGGITVMHGVLCVYGKPVGL